MCCQVQCEFTAEFLWVENRKKIKFCWNTLYTCFACAGRKLKLPLQKIWMLLILFSTWGRGALQPLMVKTKEKKIFCQNSVSHMQKQIFWIIIIIFLIHVLGFTFFFSIHVHIKKQLFLLKKKLILVHTFLKNADFFDCEDVCIIACCFKGVTDTFILKSASKYRLGQWRCS